MSSSVKDRFKELTQIQNVTINIETQNEVPPMFKEVFDKVYKIRNLIGNIRENTFKIKNIVQNEQCFATKSTYNEIEARLKDTCNIGFEITNELKNLDVKNSKKDSDSDKSTLARIKRIQYASLRQDFQNALFESNEFMEKYKIQKRDILLKQAALVRADLDNEELEKLLDDSECIHLFTDNILLQTRLAKDQLTQIEERHSELLKIEEMIVYVNEQFKQIAILVEQQKEHINRIEFHACDAINYVDQGVIEVRKAQINRKKAKKKLFIITAVVTVIITLILLYIFLN